MINIFNRIRLTSTYDEQKIQKIVTALRGNHIPYKIKIKNPNSYSLRRPAATALIGSYGVHEKCRFEYIFYVNKSDYDWAKQILYTESVL
ncbi:MAG: hypothetical protein ACI4GD_12905 [Lachnospiraceae bacterium]